MQRPVQTKDSTATDAVTARDLWCHGCGYGVVWRGEPPACPMCRGSSWRERPTPSRWN